MLFSVPFLSSDLFSLADGGSLTCELNVELIAPKRERELKLRVQELGKFNKYFKQFCIKEPGLGRSLGGSIAIFLAMLNVSKRVYLCFVISNQYKSFISLHKIIPDQHKNDKIIESQEGQSITSHLITHPLVTMSTHNSPKNLKRKKATLNLLLEIS